MVVGVQGLFLLWGLSFIPQSARAGLRFRTPTATYAIPHEEDGWAMRWIVDRSTLVHANEEKRVAYVFFVYQKLGGWCL